MSHGINIQKKKQVKAYESRKWTKYREKHKRSRVKQEIKKLANFQESD